MLYGKRTSWSAEYPSESHPFYTENRRTTDLVWIFSSLRYFFLSCRGRDWFLSFFNEHLRYRWNWCALLTVLIRSHPHNYMVNVPFQSIAQPPAISPQMKISSDFSYGGDEDKTMVIPWENHRAAFNTKVRTQRMTWSDRPDMSKTSHVCCIRARRQNWN